MAITDTDIILRLSGGAGNSDPNASLGGVMSSTAIVDNTLHNLYDKVTGTESTAGDTEYRGFYVLNNHGSLTLESAKIWVDSETSHAGANITIGLATQGLNGEMSTIATEADAPSPVVTFVEAATEGAALSLSNIPNGQKYGIWLKRVIGAGTLAKNNYTIVIKVKGDTAE